MAAQKVAVYSVSDLKNTTDDALPNYLNSLKFKQSHSLTDVRLALGYAAVSIAGVLFAADYKLGWEATKAATLWAVLVYFTLNSILTVWIWAVEKGIVYAGAFAGTEISISSSVTKYTPIYNITVRKRESGGSEEVLELSSPFTRWFDRAGFFVAKPFQQWLASEISTIGQADRTATAGKATKTEDKGEAVTSKSPAPTTPRKVGRPRKE